MSALGFDQILQLRRIAEEYLAERSPEVGECIGAGASAAVFPIRAEGGEFALKVYDPRFFADGKGAAERRRLNLQAALCKHSCKHLVQIDAVREVGNTFVTEMELVPGFDLSAALLRIPRENIAPLMAQLVSAVEFLQSRRLVHRDIKPQNIRVSHDLSRLTLLDLGVIRDLDSGSGPEATDQGPARPFIATAQYSSPEYLFWLNEPSPDLWLGLTLYQLGGVLHDLIMRRPLFADEVAMENRYALAMAVLRKVPDTFASDVPSWLCALAARALSKDMTTRLRSVQISDFVGASTVEAIAERFRKVTQVGAQPLQAAAAQQASLLKRKHLVDSTMRQSEDAIRSALSLQQLTRHGDGFNRRGITFPIVGSDCQVTMTVQFDWHASAADEVVTISDSSYLHRFEHQLSENTFSPVGDVNLEHPKVAETLIAERAVIAAGRALDQLSMGTLVSEPILL